MISFGHSSSRTGVRGVPFAAVFAPFSERGEGILAAMDDSVRIGSRVFRAVVHRAREIKTVNALSGLDDRVLKDIGVSRSEIGYIAYQSARNPNFTHRPARR